MPAHRPLVRWTVSARRLSSRAASRAASRRLLASVHAALVILLALSALLVVDAAADAGRDGQGNDAAAASAAADDSLLADASLVFVRDGALWHAPTQTAAPRKRSKRGERSDSQGAQRLAELPEDAGAVSAVLGSPLGNAVAVVFERRVAWMPLAKPEPGLRSLDCRAPAFFSLDGRQLACADDSGRVAVYRLPGQRRRLVEVPARQLVGFGVDGHLLIRDDKGLWQVDSTRPQSRQQLAAHDDLSDVHIGPRGRRAIARFQVSGHRSAGLYTFKLDGKAVPRRLLAEAEMVSWSLDGRWLAAQSSDLGACLVRASGGQYKCWRRHRAVGVSGDGATLLMVKAGEGEGEGEERYQLLLGEGEGVRPRSPRQAAAGVAAQAAWIVPCRVGCR